MARYLTGNLSNPSKEMIKTTLSAPTHTMEAERILGMLDFFLRRAPNATFGFLDSKIKARVNKALTWLDEKTLPEQEDLIQFVIRREALTCQASKNFNNFLYEEIGKRCAKANLKKERLERKQQEKDIKRAIAENAKTTNPPFVNIDKKQKQILGVILKNGNLIGQLLSHKWELDDGNMELKGIIVDQKVATKKKSITYTIGYWKVNEDEAEDIDISQEGVIADLILKDLEADTGLFYISDTVLDIMKTLSISYSDDEDGNEVGDDNQTVHAVGEDFIPLLNLESQETVVKIRKVFKKFRRSPVSNDDELQPNINENIGKKKL
nr:uncharacterized protein LOC124816287 [Hydra vulgaris]